MLSPSDSVSIYYVRLWQFGSNFFPLQKSTWASGCGRLGMAAGFGGQLEEEVTAAAEAS